jgi:hypothetical protein
MLTETAVTMQGLGLESTSCFRARSLWRARYSFTLFGYGNTVQARLVNGSVLNGGFDNNFSLGSGDIFAH